MTTKRNENNIFNDARIRIIQYYIRTYIKYKNTNARNIFSFFSYFYIPTHSERKENKNSIVRVPPPLSPPSRRRYTFQKNLSKTTGRNARYNEIWVFDVIRRRNGILFFFSNYFHKRKTPPRATATIIIIRQIDFVRSLFFNRGF